MQTCPSRSLDLAQSLCAIRVEKHRCNPSFRLQMDIRVCKYVDISSVGSQNGTREELREVYSPQYRLGFSHWIEILSPR